MAVEEYACSGVQVTQPWQASAQLVDNEEVRLQARKLRGEIDGEDEVELTQDGAKNGETRKDRGGYQPVAADPDVECSFHK